VDEYGGVGTATCLLDQSTEVQSGVTELWQCGATVFPRALDYTLEAIVWRPEFRELFTTAQLATAKGRLMSLHHSPPWVDW
jgi:hypothetical protein